MDTGMGTENVHSEEKEVRQWEDPYVDKMYEYADLDVVKFLMDAHYHLMKDKKYWNDPGEIDASRILCVTASDLRVKKVRREPEG